MIKFLRWYTGLCLIGCVILGVVFHDDSMWLVGAGLAMLLGIYFVVREDK